MPRISPTNQITIPVAVLDEARLQAGEAVTVESTGDGELRVRRHRMTFKAALGVLTGTYSEGYLDALDAEEAERESE
jgi:antitoxin component of MazEF toxin-antitoxin module